jgi:membrane associated rhomboid family serine protease
MRITLTLIGANIVVFIAQLIFDPWFTTVFALTPELALSKLYVWQFVTYMFLHGGIMHIFFNMFVLYMFGSVIEHSLGEIKYVTLYFVSGIGSAILYLVLTNIFSGGMGLSNVPMLGASGAVFGILAAYGFMFPKNTVIIPPFIPIPAIVAVIGFAVLEFFSGVFGTQPGIANFGHLGGLITGAILLFYWRNHLKLSRSDKARREFEYFWE